MAGIKLRYVWSNPWQHENQPSQRQRARATVVASPRKTVPLCLCYWAWRKAPGENRSFLPPPTVGWDICAGKLGRVNTFDPRDWYLATILSKQKYVSWGLRDANITRRLCRRESRVRGCWYSTLQGKWLTNLFLLRRDSNG